jgi:LPXTG-motif cell wall-anchored protein
MKVLTARGLGVLMAVVLGCLGAFVLAQATSTQHEIKNFEIIEVNGNKVVARGPDGTKEYTLPDDFKLDLDGKPIAVRDLKPGMKVKATITTKTTTTPVTVTEIKNGEVMVVSGTSVIVKTAEGLKQFTQEGVNARRITITREGEQVQLAELKKGDRLTATIVSQGPPRVVSERQVAASASGAPAPAEPAPAPARAPAPAAAPEPAAEPAPAAGLPKTGTSMPLLGMIGALSLATGLGLTVIRRRRATR